jgi:hypothetical protein
MIPLRAWQCVRFGVSLGEEKGLSYVFQQLSDKFMNWQTHEKNAVEYVRFNSILDRIVSWDEQFA